MTENSTEHEDRLPFDDHAQGVSEREVRSAIKGDSDAMRLVWQRNSRWVAAILLAHKPRSIDIEDLLQDVAMSFVKHVKEVREPRALRPWLRTVAVNAARAAGRGHARAQKHDPGIRLHTEVNARAQLSPDEVALDRDTGGKLLDLAMGLPEGYREPLLLRAARGMSYKQIAAITGLAETTIETRIARGRRMLRELAKQRIDGEEREGSQHTTAVRSDGKERRS